MAVIAVIMNSNLEWFYNEIATWHRYPFAHSESKFYMSFRVNEIPL